MYVCIYLCMYLYVRCFYTLFILHNAKLPVIFHISFLKAENFPGSSLRNMVTGASSSSFAETEKKKNRKRSTSSRKPLKSRLARNASKQQQPTSASGTAESLPSPACQISRGCSDLFTLPASSATHLTPAPPFYAVSVLFLLRLMPAHTRALLCSSRRRAVAYQLQLSELWMSIRKTSV